MAIDLLSFRDNFVGRPRADRGGVFSMVGQRSSVVLTCRSVISVANRIVENYF